MKRVLPLVGESCPGRQRPTCVTKQPGPKRHCGHRVVVQSPALLRHTSGDPASSDCQTISMAANVLLKLVHTSPAQAKPSGHGGEAPPRGASAQPIPCAAGSASFTRSRGGALTVGEAGGSEGMPLTTTGRAIRTTNAKAPPRNETAVQRKARYNKNRNSRRAFWRVQTWLRRQWLRVHGTWPIYH